MVDVAYLACAVVHCDLVVTEAVAELPECLLTSSDES